MEWLSNYNYDFAMASIPIQLVLLAFYLSRRNLPIRQSWSFLAVMVANLTMTASDIVSCEMNEIWESFPLWVMYVINQAYFLSFILRGWALFDYTSEACHSHLVVDRRITHAFWVPAFALCAIICSTPWTAAIFHFDPGVGYHNCGLYFLIYWSTYFYIGASLAYVALCWRRCDLRVSIAMLGYNAILIAGILLRGLFVNTLVTSYFSILAILVIYLSAQNPDLYRSKRVGTFNQSAFDEIVSELLLTGRPFHCLIVTLPTLGAARSLYGHDQTVRSLALIGAWLSDTYRDHYVFTGSGEHFVLLRAGDADEASETCARGIKARFALPWETEGTDVALGASVVLLPHEIMPNTIADVDDLVRYVVDNSRYQAPDEYVVVTQEMVDQMRRHEAVEQAVGRALAANAIQIHLQPIYGVRERRIVAAEALARLTDVELGEIPPDEFIGVAERNGDIMELGRQVFDRVCGFLERNDVATLGVERINVNLSPAQCMNTQLASELSRIAESHHVPMDMVNLEITESAAEDLENISTQMNRLLAEGVTFSLDDFGTGTSNITRLMSLPFSVVKLDMTVVWSYFSGASPLLPNLISMFHDVSKRCVVEGIETEEMHAAVMEMDCDYEQGFYFSRPLPEAEFMDYLRASA